MEPFDTVTDTRRSRGRTMGLLRGGVATVAVATVALVMMLGATNGQAADDPYCTNYPTELKRCVIPLIMRLNEACRPTCPPPPQPTSKPTINGAAKEGQLLVASQGGWSGSPVAYAAQWYRCPPNGSLNCTPIAGASEFGYRVSADDVGYTLRVAVRAGNAGGLSGESYSDPTAVVTVGPPVRNISPSIAGVPVEGNSMTVAFEGQWYGTPPFSRGYQWLRCLPDGAGCEDIAGATARSYVLNGDDVGRTIKVRETATNGQGSASSESHASREIQAAQPLAPPDEGDYNNSSAETAFLRPDPNAEAEAGDPGSGKAFNCDFRVHLPHKIPGLALAVAKVTQDCKGTGIRSQAITSCLSHINANGNLVNDGCGPAARFGAGKLIATAYFNCNRNERRTFFTTGTGRIQTTRGTTLTPPPPYQLASTVNCSN